MSKASGCKLAKVPSMFQSSFAQPRGRLHFNDVGLACNTPWSTSTTAPRLVFGLERIQAVACLHIVGCTVLRWVLGFHLVASVTRSAAQF